MKKKETIRDIYQAKLKEALKKATGCTVQHDGWTCGTCFYAIDDKLTNKDWQTVLYIRGDYELQDLDSLPKDMTKSIEKILKLCGK